MEQIESFKINHLLLEKGLYVSRIDKFVETYITTFDMRLTAPNKEPVVDMPAMHTIEHLGATFLRNSNIKEKVVYFGPMGCRTGCYILIEGKLTSQQILPIVLELCDFILNYNGEIPGATPICCGNYSEQNLEMAKFYIKNYKQSLQSSKNLEYKS